jgi:hypothetical protein
MNVLTSKYSKESALALGEALGCSVYNPYQREFYKGSNLDGGVNYNMGCSSPAFANLLNQPEYVLKCVDKIATFNLLEQHNVLIVPWTRDKAVAQGWLDSDRIIVNRATTTGKANEGLSYSYKGLEDTRDIPLSDDAIIWTRYVNHTRELRAYVFKGKAPLIFEKVDVNGQWFFKPVQGNTKLLDQVGRSQAAFSGLVFSAFDILECVTGDYYTLECNSAPSLLVSNKIIPRLKEVIENDMGRGV